MRPGVKNVKLYRGSTDPIIFWLKDKNRNPLDLRGATITAYLTDGDIRRDYTVNNGIEALSLEGKITIKISVADKVGLKDKASWACKVTWSNGDVWRVLEGEAVLVPEK